MRNWKAAVIAGAMSLVMAASALAGCGTKLDGTKEAIVVNGEAVNLGTANFILRYQEAESYNMIMSYGLFGSGTQFWDQAMSSDDADEDEAADSSAASSASSASSADASSASSEAEDTGRVTTDEPETYGDDFRNSVQNMIEKAVLLRQHAADYGVSIDADLQGKIDAAAAQMVADNADLKEKVGCTEADIKEALALMTYESIMKESMVADIDRDVSDEEAAQKRISYVRFKLQNTDDDGNTSDMTDEEKEEVKKKAQQLIDELNATDDPAAADLEAMATAIDEDAYTGSYSYDTENSVMGDVRTEASDTLSDGEVYPEPVEDGTGLYVIRMDTTFDREATDTRKETIISERENERFDEIIEQWRDEMTIDVKDVWKKLKVTDTDAYVAVKDDATEDTGDTSGVEVVTGDDAGETDEADTQAVSTSSAE